MKTLNNYVQLIGNLGQDVELREWLDEEVSFNQEFAAALGQLPMSVYFHDLNFTA